MTRSSPRYFIMLSLAGLLALALWLSLRPQAVEVDMAHTSRGPMQVLVEDEGHAQIRDVFTVSAPLGGKLLRVSLRAGDHVEARSTVLASIIPSDPVLLDDRSRLQAEANVRSAEAARTLAATERKRSQAELSFSEAQFKRGKALAERDDLSDSELDKLRLAQQAAAAAMQAANAAVQMREAELLNARAVLNPASDSNVGLYVVRAPISGRVLQIFQDSETVVHAGQALLSIGDPRQMEIVTDLLSSDAVSVLPSAEVILSAWGGDRTLLGQVSRIEPFGFTKLSALGVEEQRVNVVIQLSSPYEEWSALQHGYRVDVAITLWQSDDVLRVPASALFREKNQWFVYTEQAGRAQKTELSIGHMNGQWGEVLAGLQPSQQVLTHPPVGLQSGQRIKARTVLD